MTQNEINEMFERAVMNGTRADVAKALGLGADLFMKDETGNNILAAAAFKSNIDTFDYLLKVSKGGVKLDLNEINKEGDTLIFSLIKGGAKFEFIKKLIDAGANPNEYGEGENKLPPLLYALANDKVELVEMLVNSGADVNVQMKRTGTTPLLMLTTTSVTKHAPEIFDLLVNAGADVNAKDINGRTPAMNIELRTKELLKQNEMKALEVMRDKLWDHPNFDNLVIDNFGGDVLFFHVYENGFTKESEKLIAKGSNINLWQNLFIGKTINTSTAHLIAMRAPSIFKRLPSEEEKEKYIEGIREGVKSAITEAAASGQPLPVNANGLTEMEEKAEEEIKKLESKEEFFDRIFNLFQTHGVDLTKANSEGNSIATYGLLGDPEWLDIWVKRQYPIANTYYEMDRKTNAYTEVNLFARMIAMSAKDDVLAYMIDNGIKITEWTEENDLVAEQEPIFAAITTLNVNALSMLLAAGVDPNMQVRVTKSGEYFTPLRVMASGVLTGNYLEALNALAQMKRLKEGYEENEVNGVENTIMTKEVYDETCKKIEALEKVAAQIESFKAQAFNELITGGADINFLDKNNRTPIFYVNDVQSMEIMETFGADLFAKNEAGESYLEYLLKHKPFSPMIPEVMKRYALNGDALVVRPFYEIAFMDVANSHDLTESLMRSMQNFFTEEERVALDKNYKIESVKETLSKVEERLAKQLEPEDVEDRNLKVIEKLETDVVNLKAKLEELGEPAIISVDGINYQDEEGNSPLLIACANNNPRFAKMFLDVGADINLANKNGETPLMHAIATESYRLVDFLLKRGADVNAVRADGMTVLEMAENIDNGEVLEVVMRKINPEIEEGSISNKRKLTF